jgi:hypothetical protein
MPPTVGGAGGTWSIIDFMTDLSSDLLPGLDPLQVAPIDHENDPPPGQFGSMFFVPVSADQPEVAAPGTALTGVTVHRDRMWGFIGNSVFASGGPDTVVGNGFTAWPPAQEFSFPSKVVLLWPTTTGLLVFTTTDLFIIGGDPAITDYYSQPFVKKLGILSPNAVCEVHGQPAVFTSDRQLILITPGAGITKIGHTIGDQLLTLDPSTVYLTFHRYGDLDEAIFIGDGVGSWLGLPTSAQSDQGPDLVLAAKPDYCFAGDSGKSFVSSATGGTHGFLNSDPNMQAIFLAWGFRKAFALVPSRIAKWHPRSPSCWVLN